MVIGCVDERTYRLRSPGTSLASRTRSFSSLGNWRWSDLRRTLGVHFSKVEGQGGKMKFAIFLWTKMWGPSQIRWYQWLTTIYRLYPNSELSVSLSGFLLSFNILLSNRNIHVTWQTDFFFVDRKEKNK